ncbi:MAG: diacylglycerol kinase family protein [Candidatus Bipolaricaulaceae bacterium]
MRTIPVILNPVAGRGSAGERVEEVRRAFAAVGLRAEILRTEGPGQATELACALCGRGAEVVVAAGGDGTVNEVAQALVGTKTALAVLPLGSGNDFARALGLPMALEKAVEVLARGRKRRVDVGEANGRYYLNALGMGIDGQIAHHYRRHRFLRGELGYLLATVFEVLRFRPFGVEVRAGEERFCGELLAVAAMNGPWAGGGFCLAPQARPDDGLLDLALLGHYPRLVRLMVLPKTRDGSYLRLARARLLRTAQVRVYADRPLFVHADGELFPERVAALEVVLFPHALSVLA